MIVPGALYRSEGTPASWYSVDIDGTIIKQDPVGSLSVIKLSPAWRVYLAQSCTLIEEPFEPGDRVPVPFEPANPASDIRDMEEVSHVWLKTIANRAGKRYLDFATRINNRWFVTSWVYEKGRAPRTSAEYHLAGVKWPL